MDNENGTTAVVGIQGNETKTVADVATKPADTIDSVSIEPAKSADVKSTKGEIVESSVNLDEKKRANSTELINKTTTTVTVHVTQTKVTIDDANTKNDVGEVVSSMANIAEVTINAAEKVEQSLEQSAKNVVPNESENDVDMPEANNDIEMKDVSTVEEPQTTNNVIETKTKTAEADSVHDNNEAEQKIDEVEKNISNLFNGDDNVVSTNSQSFDGSSIVEPKAGTTSSEALKNGPNGSSKESLPDDVIKDNNDLVSILAGNDKSDDKSDINQAISSSQSDLAAASEPTSSQDANVTNQQSKAIEIKNLKKASTPSSSTKTAVAYNSTSINQKQFGNSSEIVSNISESAIDTEHILDKKLTRQEIISSHSSMINKRSSDLSSSSSAVTEFEKISSDNLARFAKAVRTLNGSSDDTDTSSGKPEPVSSKKEIGSTVATQSKATPTATASVSTTSENHVYDVNICYDSKELVYFSVERIEPNKTNPISDNSSIGRVNSVHETFALPARCAAVTSTNSTLSLTSSELGTTNVTSNTEKSKHEVKGTLALCDLVIAHFTKMSKMLKGPDDEDTLTSTETTPISTSGRRRGTPTTPSIQASGSKRKRGIVQASPVELDPDDQTKSAKKAKKSTEPTTPTTSNYPEKVVLARWVDKKFYAGRVTDQKPNNKYVVLFEDGAKKVLPEEHIVFGDQNILPLMNESVHALVKEDTYEPGIVQSVETKDDGLIYYSVLCESTTVTVTASDIYLEEDQAKAILSKHASNNPEPGFSGGINTRKDRRQKRAENNRPSQWFSESDVSDIVETDSRPASPVTILEAVDGVQPELQHTQKESELVRICYLMERYGDNFKTVNLDNVLGPIITTNILKNKCFLLTCTIPIKSVPNGTPGERQHVKSNGYDFGNRNMTFSEVPFFKDYLKQQIEAAGGTVYNNFENVPANKYRNCFLLAPFPCITAKYVQCLAANISAVSHEWIVECCQRNKLVSKDEYLLPSGWSIIDNTYKPWSTGRGRDQRKNTFNKTTIILTSQQNEFVLFWSRVCKSAGAKIRLVKSTADLTATTKGYILLDDEFPPEYQSRAERFRIPIVSTVWVVQSLISGKVCDPNRNPKLTQLYEDDYF